MKHTLHRFAGIAVGVVAVSVGLAWYGLGAIAQTCINPNPVPQGYAAPCPVLSAVANAGTLAVTVTPPGGISFTLNKIYVSETVNDCPGKVSSWCPYMLPGPYAYTDWKTAPSSLSLNIAQMNLSAGMHYIVAWNWTWDAVANGGRGCYKGPGLNTCDTGAWHIQPFDPGGASTTPPPGSGPMLFLNMTINGNGPQSSISVQASPLIGYYTSPVLDDGEYVAKLLDANGEAVFMHGFNAPNALIAEGDDGQGKFSPGSGGTDITTLNTAVVLPAISGAQTLQLTTAAGAPIMQQQVAGAVMEANRKFAKYYPYTPNWLVSRATAAGGKWKIAVLGVNYPSQAAFNADLQAFDRHLRSTSPYSKVSGSIVISQVFKDSATPFFNPEELGCYYHPTCKGYYCPGVEAANKTVRLNGYDNILVFALGPLSGGCADVDGDRGNSRYATINTMGNSDKAGRVAVHEISHSFGALLDEYDYGAAYSGGYLNLAGNPRDFNCEPNRSCPSKWRNVPGTSCTPGCVTMAFSRSIPDGIMSEGMYNPTPLHFGPFDELLVEKQIAKFGIIASPVQDTQPPIVNMASLKNMQVLNGIFSLWAKAYDNVGVSRVELYADNQLLGSGVQGADLKMFNYEWRTTTIPDGLHEVFAKAFDAAGNSGESQRLKVVVANGTSAPLLKSDSDSYKVSSFFTLTITANSSMVGKSVKFRWEKGGAPWTPSWGVGCVQFDGYTWCDPGGANQPVITANGTWTASGTYDTSLIGDWKEQALLGGNTKTNEITFSIANPAGAPGGNGPCATKDGLEVICMQEGGSYTLDGSVTYGSGFPSGMPAMGLGSVMSVGGVKIGYIPMSAPFSCMATAGALGVSASNAAGGKICEVLFNNASPGTGSGSYTITADANAPAGDYLFGFGANSGTTVQTPDFYIRIQ